MKNNNLIYTFYVETVILFIVNSYNDYNVMNHIFILKIYENTLIENNIDHEFK